MAAPVTSPIGSVRPPLDFNPPPKTRFRETADWISRHKALLELAEFERAVTYALLQYQRELAAATVDANTALAAGYKLTGAQELIRVLRTLTVTAPAPTLVQQDNLAGNLS